MGTIQHDADTKIEGESASRPSDARAKLSRRSVLKQTVLNAGLAAASMSMVHSEREACAGEPGPNDRIETAVIGIGARGKYLLGNFPERLRPIALCDCSLDQIATATDPSAKFRPLLDRFVSGDSRRCAKYQDYRKMLDKQSFDAVVIAAPDHHHALAMIRAAEAGAHVYVEKPLAVTIAEGRAMVHAAKRHRRVVQVGSQQRTMQVNRKACEFVRDGGLGKVSLVEERNFPGPMPYESSRFEAGPIPGSLDWELFCGPTPLRPYHQDLWVKDAYRHGYLTWRGWDLFRDYSGHLMTNWGAHSVDMIQFALGMDDCGPSEIELRTGEIDSFIDDAWHQKTPPLGSVNDSRVDRLRFAPVVMRYPSGTEVHFKPGIRKTTFHGERGTLTISRNQYRSDPIELLGTPDSEEQSKWDGEGHVARPHLQNWVEAMSGEATLNAPIEVGHRTATACHLANIARQIGKGFRWDPINETVVGKSPASESIDRPRREGFDWSDHS